MTYYRSRYGTNVFPQNLQIININLSKDLLWLLVMFDMGFTDSFSLLSFTATNYFEICLRSRSDLNSFAWVTVISTTIIFFAQWGITRVLLFCVPPLIDEIFLLISGKSNPELRVHQYMSYLIPDKYPSLRRKNISAPSILGLGAFPRGSFYLGSIRKNEDLNTYTQCLL
jgi:hypothetical protein